MGPEKLNMRSKYLVQWFIIGFCAFTFCAVATAFAQTDREAIAMVNQKPITRRDLQIELALLTAEMEQRNRTMSKRIKAELSRKLLKNLIERELLHQTAQQKEIKIQSHWVEHALSDFKTKLRTPSAYQSYLRKATLDEAQFKARIEKGLIVRRLLRRDVIRQIKVTEAEIQAFYRQYPDFFQTRAKLRVRQIMIGFGVPGNISKKGDALLRIQAVQNKIQNGQNFAALALEYSEDSSRYNGGDLGYLESGQIIPPLADAVHPLAPGQVSDIVETRMGYHLVQLVDRIPASQVAYRNARTKIERTIRRNKENSATETYLTRLRRQADIKRLVRP